jgi:hypothetical protein
VSSGNQRKVPRVKRREVWSALYDTESGMFFVSSICLDDFPKIRQRCLIGLSEVELSSAWWLHHLEGLRRMLHLGVALGGIVGGLREREHYHLS